MSMSGGGKRSDTPGTLLPVSVLTGFLGSGKTTLLRHLLAHPEMGETAVVINEFGEIGLDHRLVESASEDMVLLNSGCLCCSVRGDLIDSLRRLFLRRVRNEVPPYERVLIETTGLADPAPVLHTLMNDPILSEVFRLDGVITTVDAAVGAASLDQHTESVKQAAVADRLLITKSDLVGPDALAALERRLEALNPAAPRYRIEQGRIDPGRLLDAGLYNPETKSLDVRRWLKAEAYAEQAVGRADRHHHDHDHDHGHAPDHRHDVNRHDDRIRAFCLRHEAPLDWDRFHAWIEMLIALHGADILRLKGLLNLRGQALPVAIHGVQHVFHPPVSLPAWPPGARCSELVFIVRDLDPALFGHTLEAFQADRDATREPETHEDVRPG